MSDEVYDVAVIGGGPAGLHAAAKAALLFRSCVLFDKGRKYSRIFWSPKVDNLPGSPPKSGRDIIRDGYATIDRIHAELGRTFVTVHADVEVTRLERDGEAWRISTADVSAWAHNVVLATGCVDTQPQLRDFRKRDIESVLPYANKGLADYCLLCDGHTVEGKRVAVIGCDPGSRGIAKSLKKNFGADTAIVPFCNTRAEGTTGPADPQEAWEAVEADLARWEIPLLYGEIDGFTGIKDGQFGIRFTDGTEQRFDKAWISMGWYQVNNAQAVQAGAAVDRDGFVLTDKDGRVLDRQGMTIAGLYCIGDLRSDSWKQIPIAWGEAEAAVVDAFVRR